MDQADDSTSFCNTSTVRVIARVRPSSAPDEIDCVACPLDNTLEVVNQEGRSLQFIFDEVHGPPNGAGNTQADIFSDIQDIVLGTVPWVTLEGVNGCVMAYGQTGAGKTHTITGNLESSTEQGLLTRSYNQLAQAISEVTDGSHFQVHLSVVEIHNESIKDLLSKGPGSTSLAVQQDKELGTTIAGATKVAVTDVSGLVNLTQQALATAASTSLSAASDCSKCLITLTVQRRLPSKSVIHGKLTLVDLAGSEQQPISKALGWLVEEEGKRINMSLSALGNAIEALADPSGPIACQDSMLALALQGALQGKARMAAIVCCSPAAASAAETLSTLRLGTLAEGITTSMQAKAVRKAAGRLQMAAYGRELKLDAENQRMRESLLKTAETFEEAAEVLDRAAKALDGAKKVCEENNRLEGIIKDLTKTPGEEELNKLFWVLWKYTALWWIRKTLLALPILIALYALYSIWRAVD